MLATMQRQQYKCSDRNLSNLLRCENQLWQVALLKNKKKRRRKTIEADIVPLTAGDKHKAHHACHARIGINTIRSTIGEVVAESVCHNCVSCAPSARARSFYICSANFRYKDRAPTWQRTGYGQYLAPIFTWQRPGELRKLPKQNKESARHQNDVKKTVKLIDY